MWRQLPPEQKAELNIIQEARRRRRRNLFAEDKNMITHDNYNEPNNYIVFSRLPERPKPINAGCLLIHVYRPDS
jgi:hypothetical protein